MLNFRSARCNLSPPKKAFSKTWGYETLLTLVRQGLSTGVKKMPEIGEKRDASSLGDTTITDVAEQKKPRTSAETRLLNQTEAVAAPDGCKTLKTSETDNLKSSSSNADFEQKWKLKKFAMCLMYCGKGYLGMQRNPGAKTIEEDLLRACLNAGLITEDSYNNPQNMMFQRAARTDKGVSAARQVVSLKLPTTKGSPEEMTGAINARLVDQIRVVGLKRVTKNFNSKNNADARTYSYVMPTFAFAPPDVIANEKYRLTSDRVEKANSYLKLYLGSHNFHNFTAGKLSNDPSAMRYIKEIECSQPFLVDNFEYVQIRVKGQSFMLHQIRKMIGLVIAIMRGNTEDSIIKRAWGPEKLDIPKAPALGLMLEQVHYDRYNSNYGGDGMHEELTWTERQPDIHTFKHSYIYPNIWSTEKNDDSMGSWMAYLPLHSYDVREHEVKALCMHQIQEEDFEAGDPDDDSIIINKCQEPRPPR
ncbi:tRNA pseudouridine synthase A, mitochondrial-like [Varroa destructor]|uniref:Pseudouridylate synthase 1 homolog n=1 Tax=Varroa destructor TaxID=109461 RepID=A0A7M7MAV9_VARDE|nr:tRNA pseudouridine synthase A, mitochondrial-like [Varroa destructor]